MITYFNGKNPNSSQSIKINSNVTSNDKDHMVNDHGPARMVFSGTYHICAKANLINAFADVSRGARCLNFRLVMGGSRGGVGPEPPTLKNHISA